jgi:hypothetical protein
MPTKVFTPGEILTAANTNAYLANKGISNAVINGGFDIWQRGTTLTGSGYIADRWNLALTSNTATTSRQNFTSNELVADGFGAARHYARVANTAVTNAGSLTIFRTFLEDVRTLAGETVTLSFWAKADSTKNIYIDISQETTKDSVRVSTPIGKKSISTQWTRYSYSISLPEITNTIAENNFLAIRFWLSAGSNFNAITDTLGEQNITFDIWGVQLEAGTVANDFRRNANSIQGELAACQRYYYRINFEQQSAFATFGLGFVATTTVAKLFVAIPAMRTKPSSVDFASGLVLEQPNGGAFAAFTIGLDAGITSSSQAGVLVGSTGLTANSPIFLRAANDVTDFLGFSAEL